MDSSRVFVRGVPPNMTANDFQRHFSKQWDITDSRLIPHRRIGYVGYKTPEEAIKAVKYHNKSFINMSRITVELARSVDQENALNPRKHARPQSLGQTPVLGDPLLQAPNPSHKRKRDDKSTLEEHPKLQEFLEVMKPVSKSRTWANENGNGKDTEAGQQDHIITNGIEDGAGATQSSNSKDYQEVPQKLKTPRKDTEGASSTPVETLPLTFVPGNTDTRPATEIVPPAGEPESSTMTDDDWLRSRTSRLLGLVDDEDTVLEENPGPERLSNSEASGNVQTHTMLGTSNTDLQAEGELVQPTDTKASPEAQEAHSAVAATDRLFVRNLPYTVTEQELRAHFEQVGSGHVEEVHVPIDHHSGKNKGFAYIQYSDSDAAAKVLHDLDSKPFQGRLLHIMSSAAKRPSGLDEIAISKLPLKKQQQIKRKAAAASTSFNWNSLYMNTDAVMSSISDRLGILKSELLDPTSADAAVKQAHAETHVIQETKSYFSASGVNLDAFKRKERGDTAILVKNFSYGTKPDELHKLFEVYGTIRRLLMPPSGTIAIVDFFQADHARSAFSALAYRKFKDSVLFLEKAPKDLFTSGAISRTEGSSTTGGARGAKHSTGELLESMQPQQSVNTSTLFVRNLNFTTTSDRLREVFQPLDGLLSARVKTKPDPKNAGHVLSMGFGFLEFRTKEQAQAALVAMDGHNLDDHELLIRASHKGADAAEERRRDDAAKKLAAKNTKVIIKNLPFEASKKDVRSLFGAYGQLRSVRMPRKFDSSTRGFAFAEFVTAREAENAIDALKDTHLLGRRLVLDFSAEDEIDPEQEIAKMQQKAGNQADKVALQRLVGTGRKKFNREGNDDTDVY